MTNRRALRLIALFVACLGLISFSSPAQALTPAPLPTPPHPPIFIACLDHLLAPIPCARPVTLIAPIAEQTPEPEPPPPAPLSPHDRLVALTFDDGPHPTLTPLLLDILDYYGIPATFFVTGRATRARPQIVARAHQAGHEIGAHSFNHDSLPRLSPSAIRYDSAATNSAIQDATGSLPMIFRPPFGSHNATVRENIPQPFILWDVDPRDWADRDAQIIHDRVLYYTRDGSIILLHDIHLTSIQSVPLIINSLLDRDFTFVTVSQLFEIRDIPLEPSMTYFRAPPPPMAAPNPAE